MLLKFFETTGQRATYGLHDRHLPEPTIEAGSGELGEPGQGHLTNLVRVEVQGPDGRFARAWVSARLNDRGQVQFQLATNKREHTTRANVTANWRL